MLRRETNIARNFRNNFDLITISSKRINDNKKRLARTNIYISRERFSRRKIDSFDYKFNKKQTTIRKSNLHDQYFKENRLHKNNNLIYKNFNKYIFLRKDRYFYNLSIIII